MSRPGQTVDDRDASIVYQGTWVADNAAGALRGTQHVTGQNGAIARIEFTGTGIAATGTVFGQPGPDPYIDNISILKFQNEAASPVQLPRISGHYYNFTFFERTDLPYARYTLTVEHSAGKTALDYFTVYGVRTETSPKPPVLPPSSSRSVSSPSSSTSVRSSTQSPSSSTTTSSSRISSTTSSSYLTSTSQSSGVKSPESIAVSTTLELLAPNASSTLPTSLLSASSDVPEPSTSSDISSAFFSSRDVPMDALVGSLSLIIWFVGRKTSSH